MNYSDKKLYMLFTDREQLRVVVFLLFASCILAVSLTFFALSMGRPYMGTTLAVNAQGWTVESVDHNGLANRVGISKGDRPVEINGQAADAFLGKYRKAGVVFGALLRELTVVASNGQLKSVALEDGTLSLQGVIQQIVWLFVSLIFCTVGLYVFLKRPRNAASSLLCLIGLFFGLMLSSNMIWAMGVSKALYVQVFAMSVGPWLILHFFLVLPEERSWLHNNPRVYAVYIPAAITLVLYPLIGLANDQPVQWFRTFRLLEVGVGLIAAGGVAIYNYLGAVSIKTRQQMKIVLIACMAAIVPFLLLYLLPEAIWRQKILPPEFSILLVSFIPLGMGYAVVTRKLMDIDVFIRRGVVYGLITMVMAIILSVAIILALVYQKSLTVPQEIVLALVLGAIATILFSPAKKGIETLVDRLLYKDRYEYRQIIQSLSTSLKSANDLNDVSRLVVGVTVHTLNLAGGCLFLKTQSNPFQVTAAQGTFTAPDKQKQMLNLISERSQTTEFPNLASTVYEDIAFLVPLMAGGQEVGMLCLSKKSSRQDFSSDDIYLLQGIASVTAMALHSIMLIRDVSMRDTFVSVASHELRTPMTSILGYADLLLRRDPPDATRQRWLKNIIDNSQRVSHIVDDLLNVSRIQSGKATIRLESARLPDILEETLYLIRESTDKHEFAVDIEPALPDVLADRDKLSQVIVNLLSNAVKYSPNGGLITLSAHHDKVRNRIVVSVTDEGIGISPEDKASLFTTFHRIQRPETQGIRGSGLGLYIAKEWVEKMGGEIRLESELNKGSTFFIALPSSQDYGRTS